MAYFKLLNVLAVFALLLSCGIVPTLGNMPRANVARIPRENNFIIKEMVIEPVEKVVTTHDKCAGVGESCFFLPCCKPYVCPFWGAAAFCYPKTMS